MKDFFQINLSNISFFIQSTLIIFGGIVPFIPQYFTIKRSNNANGFSPYVCLLLIIANSLRIAFRFGKEYPNALLFQSIIMIFTMLLMLSLTVRIRQKYSPLSSIDYNFTFRDFNFSYFWKWTDFMSYVEFSSIFLFASASIAYLFRSVPIFIELIGFAALLSEALLGFPQLINNFKNKSTVGMSYLMVLMWLSGDIFKCVYFKLESAPIQFLLCGLVQIAIDLLIIAQWCFYKLF